MCNVQSDSQSLLCFVLGYDSAISKTVRVVCDLDKDLFWLTFTEGTFNKHEHSKEAAWPSGKGTRLEIQRCAGSSPALTTKLELFLGRTQFNSLLLLVNSQIA